MSKTWQLSILRQYFLDLSVQSIVYEEDLQLINTNNSTWFGCKSRSGRYDMGTG